MSGQAGFPAIGIYTGNAPNGQSGEVVSEVPTAGADEFMTSMLAVCIAMSLHELVGIATLISVGIGIVAIGHGVRVFQRQMNANLCVEYAP